MRKSFLTRAVVAAGVMVSAMALSGIAVFAEPTESVWFPGTNIDGLSLDDTWSEQTVSSGYTAEFEDKIFTVTNPDTSEISTTGVVGGQKCYRSSEKTGLSISTNAENAKVTLYLSRNNKSSGSYLKKVGSTAYDSSVYPVYQNRYTTGTIPKIELTIAQPGTYDIEFNNNGIELYKAIILDEVATKANYTLNVTDYITNTTITSYTVKDSSGTTVTGTSGVYNLIEGREYTVSSDGYIDTTFTTGESTTVAVGMISNSATKKSLAVGDIATESNATSTADELANGFLITAGIKNQEGKYIRVQNNGTVQFKLTTNGAVAFEGVRSPNSTERKLLVQKNGSTVVEFANINTDSTGFALLEAGTYTIAAEAEKPMQFSKVTVYGTTEDMTLADTTISSQLATISGLTANDKLSCVAKYAKVDGTHYLVLDFTKNDALTAASELTYSVSGQAKKSFTELYTGVKFDAEGNDILSEGNHLYYAFKFTDNHEPYTSINATIGVAN